MQLPFSPEKLPVFPRCLPGLGGSGGWFWGFRRLVQDPLDSFDVAAAAARWLVRSNRLNPDPTSDLSRESSI